MTKQTQNFTQLLTELLVYMVITSALFFSSCKKEEILAATRPTYNVTFDSRGGSAISLIKVKQGDTLTLPADPTKTGFIFDGWYADNQANTTPFSTSTTITADVTLYAKWNAVASAGFSLSSTSFADGGEIPERCTKSTLFSVYSNDSQNSHLNVSPQLSWVNAPTGTTSFFVLMQKDNDNDELFNHSNWAVYNIPAGKTSLTENDSSIQINSNFYNCYKGPWASKGKTYTYQITIYALDLPEDYFNLKNSSKYPPTTKEEAENRLNDHILASAAITGTFTGK